MTRNKSVVAALMTDLQPYALNTRLSYVNFDSSTATWERLNGISLFRCGDISPLKL